MTDEATEDVDETSRRGSRYGTRRASGRSQFGKELRKKEKRSARGEREKSRRVEIDSQDLLFLNVRAAVFSFTSVILVTSPRVRTADDPEAGDLAAMGSPNGLERGICENGRRSALSLFFSIL